MRVIIAGPRTIYSTALVRLAMAESPFNITEIVSGAARGIDQAAIDVASIDGIALRTFPADWDTYGNGAGPIRNRQMAEYADALIAIWNGVSTGTGHMIRTMRGPFQKPVHITWTSPSAWRLSGEPVYRQPNCS